MSGAVVVHPSRLFWLSVKASSVVKKGAAVGIHEYFQGHTKLFAITEQGPMMARNPSRSRVEVEPVIKLAGLGRLAQLFD